MFSLPLSGRFVLAMTPDISCLRSYQRESSRRRARPRGSSRDEPSRLGEPRVARRLARKRAQFRLPPSDSAVARISLRRLPRVRRRSATRRWGSTLVHDAVAGRWRGGSGGTRRVGRLRPGSVIRTSMPRPSSGLRVLTTKPPFARSSTRRVNPAVGEVGEVGEFPTPAGARVPPRKVHEYRVLAQGDVRASLKVLVEKPRCRSQKPCDGLPCSFLAAPELVSLVFGAMPRF